MDNNPIGPKKLSSLATSSTTTDRITGVSPGLMAGRLTSLSAWMTEFGKAFAEVRPIAAILAVYALAAIATSIAFDESLIFSLLGSVRLVAGMAEISFALALMAMLLRIGLHERAKHPTRRMFEQLRSALQPERAARAVLLLAAMGILQALFAFFKPLIPRFAAFSWDPVFVEADRLLFFGSDAWRVMWPVLGNPPATLFINVVYHLWFFWMLLAWVLVAFADRHRRENVRFFLAFVLTWTIGGTVLAILFSSVGPCYYGNFDFGPDPFTGLLAGLDAIDKQVPVFARDVQALLWAGQMNPTPGKLAGISAMPSMHCATAVLLTLIADRHDRRLGIASGVVAMLIFVGSIHLGWHYAVDGIAGALLAYAAWIGADRLLARTAAD